MSLDPPTPPPVADNAVRAARVTDAARLGALQAASWRAAYADVLPTEDVAAVDERVLAASWDRAVRAAPSTRHRVLVATEAEEVVGFAALAPTGDPDLDPERDAELLVLLVGQDRRGRGHGSRLLAAAADVSREGGTTVLHAWVGRGDEQLRTFLESAGWAADGATRELDLRDDGTVVVAQERLHAAVAEDG